MGKQNGGFPGRFLLGKSIWGFLNGILNGKSDVGFGISRLSPFGDFELNGDFPFVRVTWAPN